MSRQISRVIYQTTDRFVDNETGEITNSLNSKVIRHPAEPPYIKLYINDLCLLTSVQNSLKDLLFLLLRKLDYDGFITLSTRYRKDICEKLEIKNQTLRNRLSQLVQKGLLIHEGVNEYIANPFYFARGDWKKIVEQREAFQMKITYTEQGRTITTDQIEK